MGVRNVSLSESCIHGENENRSFAMAMQIELHLLPSDPTLSAFISLANFIHRQVANLIIQHTSLLINLFLSIPLSHTNSVTDNSFPPRPGESSLSHQFLSRPVSVVHRDKSYLCFSLFRKGLLLSKCERA